MQQKKSTMIFFKNYLFPLLIIFLLTSLIYLLMFSNFFKVKVVNCQLDFEPCSDPHLLAELDSLKGQNIFQIKEGVLIAKLTSGNFQIRGGDLKVSLPSSLALQLDSIYPILGIKLSTEAKYVTLDSELRVIKYTEAYPNVPTLVVNTPLTFQVGQKLENEVVVKNALATLEIIKTIKGVTKIELEEQGNLNLYIKDKPTALLTIEKDVAYQLGALQQILEEDTITAGSRQIDVRFNQPILRSN